jgi:Excalibur calcium-binding domain
MDIFRKANFVALSVVGSLVFGVLAASQSFAAVKVFKNCTELNKVYPGGVALPGAVNAGGITKFTPKTDKALYLANKKSDRDKDGIACEK